MPTEWYLMKRPLFNSGYESDEFQNFAQDSFEEILESFIAKDIEIYEKSLSVEPVVTRAIVQNVTGDVYNNSYQRQLLCRIGTLRICLPKYCNIAKYIGEEVYYEVRNGRYRISEVRLSKVKAEAPAQENVVGED